MIPFLKLGIALVGVALVMRQCRKPSSFIGRRLARAMNVGHLGLTTWGLSEVAIEKGFTVLDVGCGGGRTIATLATLATAGKIHGIDYSPASVAVARDVNAPLIDQGRVDVQLGSVSQLPFGADTFDLVTAVETHYYWPDLPSDLKEIQRVMKPGGSIVIIAEAYRGRRMDWLYRPIMALLGANYLTADQHHQLLTGAGFTATEVLVNRPKGWLSARGRK